MVVALGTVLLALGIFLLGTVTIGLGILGLIEVRLLRRRFANRFAKASSPE